MPRSPQVLDEDPPPPPPGAADEPHPMESEGFETPTDALARLEGVAPREGTPPAAAPARIKKDSASASPIDCAWMVVLFKGHPFSAFWA